MNLRGIRGATTCLDNSKEEIFAKTKELWAEIKNQNDFLEEDLASVIFSSTPDLTAAFPATAVRQLGYDKVPLFGALEIDNPDAVKRCIRVLIHWNTDKKQDEIIHVYLHGAASLRRDIVGK